MLLLHLSMQKNEQIYGGETLASVASCKRWCVKINQSHPRRFVTLILNSLLNRLEPIAGHKNLHTACILYKDYRDIKSRRFFPLYVFPIPFPRNQ